MQSIPRLVGLVGLTAGLAACSNSNGPNASGGSVTLSVSTIPAAVTVPGPMTSGPLASPQIFANGSDTLQIDQVQLVMRRLELHRANEAACDTSGMGNECEELEFNPMLIDLPLTAGVTQAFSVAADTGTYDRLEFQIHRPESDSADLAFLQAHPSFQGISIRVTGSFNGASFTFTSDLDVEQELDLVPPVSVTDATPASLTMQVDLSTWFQTNGMLVDPATANPGQPNEAVVRSNIEQSFHAFEDENHDGRDDHSSS